MNLISTTEAAKLKGVTRQGIIKAIDRGDIDGQRLSTRSLVVIANKKFEAWTPSERSSRAQAKKKSRKSA